MTEDEDAVRAWLTVFKRLPLFDTVAPGSRTPSTTCGCARRPGRG